MGEGEYRGLEDWHIVLIIIGIVLGIALCVLLRYYFCSDKGCCQKCQKRRHVRPMLTSPIILNYHRIPRPTTLPPPRRHDPTMDNPLLRHPHGTHVLPFHSSSMTAWKLLPATLKIFEYLKQLRFCQVVRPSSFRRPLTIRHHRRPCSPSRTTKTSTDHR